MKQLHLFWAPLPGYELLISRKARDAYQFDLTLFTTTGEVIFANLHAARLFAQKINEQRDLLHHPEQAVSAAEINALGLIHEIFHGLIARYRNEKKPEVFAEALEWLRERLSPEDLETALRRFLEEFPPLDVYLNRVDVERYLAGETAGIPHRQLVLEEMLLLWLENGNPAFGKYAELFDDTPLRENTAYLPLMEALDTFFEQQPPFGPPGEEVPLPRLLQLPAFTAPHSVVEQLQFIRRRWAPLLPADLYVKGELLLGEAFFQHWGAPPPPTPTHLLRAVDFLTEEQKARFHPGAGPAPTHVPEYTDEEPEQFSPDLHWMPRLVLIAKHTLVWLDQLSRTYRRPITRLDQIPDEELDTLARRGFTGLWLIGIWERSPASKKIKQLCGNPEAEASAYSIYDYRIADALGGEAALENLKQRCRQRGIRLGCDMVPNHMGIVSRWVYEHPNWFIQLPYSPFPSYTFNGPNLSEREDIGIYLEDHYYDRTDAAVVFKWVNFRTGETRYIYHGNDGTSTPWNDTAQLDYTNPEVREAVIGLILDVARKFPIIRFDAAMTLTRKHYHRLWFPEPGSGGDIPSRAEYGLTRAEFNARMPREFWREVVDRVAEEGLDTLLLAEAFWLMEGYFVRTLGMHRVYNSAFMNMLKNEENEKYRATLKKTLEFDPEILKRFVNFMNNPDEETAIQQFGDGDKYFGVCTLLATMPGLPMFGHGQIEGFREKYGMEYRRAYLNEQPNHYLIERHEREIFPLLKKRYLFAEVEHFLLYDFYTPGGTVNENVFAYSNRHGEERALVVFHNAFDDTRGWIRTSAAYTEKGEDGNARRLVQKSLGEGLALSADPHAYCIFRDHVTGLEYIHPCRSLWEQGMYMELGAYKYHVFTDFREVRDEAGDSYARLSASLNGRGVPDIEEALKELHLQPLHQALHGCLNTRMVGEFLRRWQRREEVDAADGRAEELEAACRAFSQVAAGLTGEATKEKIARVSDQMGRRVEAARRLEGARLQKHFPLPRSRNYRAALTFLDDVLHDR
ncbi:MAG: alpha-amylase, partial [Calditrichaeota bacterium]